MEKINMLSRLNKPVNTEVSFVTDEQFDKVYPISIQKLTNRHWTPLYVARKAAQFLAAEKNVSILDIGSGVGKFCVAASHFMPDAHYYGIEQRQNLVYHADKVREFLCMDNILFLHGNFTQLDFRKYDHFYFYNSFYENLACTDKIDDNIEYSAELYQYYNRYLYRQLEQKPPGTRLATYHSMEDEIPPGYHIVGSEKNNLLKFWIKV